MGAPSGQPFASFILAQGLAGQGGVVNLASVASPGEATIGTAINVDSFAQLGNIQIKGGALIDAREINIRGGQLQITDATLFPGASFFNRQLDSVAPAGGQVNIKVSGSLTITGSETTSSLALPGIQTFNGSQALAAPVAGDAPGINIEAGSLSMSGRASIAANRYGPGNGANVVIKADTIEVRNGSSVALSNLFGGGAFPTGGGSLTISGTNMTLTSDGNSRTTVIGSTGNFHPAYGGGPTLFSPFYQFADSAPVTINLTGNLTVLDNARITTDSFAFGRSGPININAANMLLVGAGAETGRIAAQSGLVGESGSIRLTATGKIDIQNGFQVTANTFGSGNGGVVDITAGQSITLTGTNSRILSGTLQAPDDQYNGFAQKFAGLFSVVPATSFTYASLRSRLGIAPATGDLMQVLATLNSMTSAGIPLVAVTDFVPGDAGRVSFTTPLLTMNADTRIETSTGWNGNAGAVLGNVGSIFVNNGAAIRSTSGIVRLTGDISVGSGNAGSVTITATEPNTISITGRSPTTGAGSSISTTTLGAGKGGDIALNSAGKIQLLNGGQVTSSTTGAGAGGTVGVTAGESVSISSAGSGLFSTASSAGNAGQITVSTPTLTMGDRGTISVATSGAGNAGSALLNVSNFSLTGGSQVTSSTTGAGAGGTLGVTATGAGAISDTGSGLFSTASSTGNAGAIAVTTPTLTMNNGATVSVATSGAGNAGNIALTVTDFTQTGLARVDSSTTGAGQGGDLTVVATNTATISDPGSGLFSTASGSGAGGDITLQANNIQLNNGGTISANSTGTATATAGNVNIVFGDTLKMVNGSITTGADLADGGNISITATGSMLQMENSQITTSVESGVGGGGNITIGSTDHPFDFVLLKDSQIRADAFGGPGGNINIIADVYLTSGSLVSASSQLSTPGTIAIEATFTDVSGTVTQLPESPLKATELLRASCAARFAGGKASSLVLSGRDGLPIQPGGLLPSPLNLTGDAATRTSDSGFTAPELTTRLSLLRADTSDRLLTQYSLLPNAKCAL